MLEYGSDFISRRQQDCFCTLLLPLQKDLRWWHLKITGLLELDTALVQCIYEALKETH